VGGAEWSSHAAPSTGPGRMPGAIIGCADMDAMIVSAPFCRKDRSRR
jgi:hypothetical protein